MLSDKLIKLGWKPVNVTGRDYIKHDFTLSLFKSSFSIWHIQLQEFVLQIEQNFDPEIHIELLP